MSSTSGKAARDHGEIFEEVLQKFFWDPLLHAGRLRRLDKLHPKIKPLKRQRGQKLEWVQSERSGCDWVGLTHRDRYIAIEAKSVAGDRLPFVRVAEQQREHLDQTKGHGVALLMVEYRIDAFRREWLAIPWGEVTLVRARTAMHIDYLQNTDFTVRGWQDMVRLGLL